MCDPPVNIYASGVQLDTLKNSTLRGNFFGKIVSDEKLYFVKWWSTVLQK